VTWDADRELALRIAAGDEDAFAGLIDSLHRPLSRVAEAYLGRGPAAEDVLQETWASVVDHLASYEGRSALRTWITRILINHAKTRNERERRFVPIEDDGAAVESRFSPAGFFNAMPSTPEASLVQKESGACLLAALDRLPDAQRSVVTLRDIEEWSSEEVCNALGISESNQRVLLHRGRQRLRAALEETLGEVKR
jgi:RNA polymerase sigma-70 factor (ECF subfamily)